MTEFDGKCPFCRSENIEVEDSTKPEWGNNDEGDMIETWKCLDCNRQWSTEARVNVVHRKIESITICPFCGENDAQKLPTESAKYEWYSCRKCNRIFGYYGREQE